jgi:hypothetical protein
MGDAPNRKSIRIVQAERSIFGPFVNPHQKPAMNIQPFALRGLLVLVGAAMLPAPAASASDRARIPLPPPPGEVIRDVRGFIHGIGRSIKRGAQQVFTESDGRPAPPPPPRGNFAPNGEWNGEFYPDEFDNPDMRRQYRRPAPPREDRGYGLPEEEQLRREQASREAAQNYRPSDPGVTPPTAPQKNRKEPSTEAARTPAPPPTEKGSVKESAPAPSAPKTETPSSDVQYASPVPGKKGLVYPPGVEKKPENMVDVGDFQPGQLVRNPRNGELFRVP